MAQTETVVDLSAEGRTKGCQAWGGTSLPRGSEVVGYYEDEMRRGALIHLDGHYMCGCDRSLSPVDSAVVDRNAEKDIEKECDDTSGRDTITFNLTKTQKKKLLWRAKRQGCKNLSDYVRQALLI